MTRVSLTRTLTAAAALLIATGVTARSQTPGAAALFDTHCATCHSGAADSRAPGRQNLSLSAPAAILRALTTGPMQVQGARLSADERRALAEYLAGRPLADPATSPPQGRCASSPPMADPAGSPRWNGWGVDIANRRFQPAAQAKLAAADVPRLELKWAFGFPDATSAWSQPVVAAGRLFVGSQNGLVYSLDAKTGCTYWAFSASAAVRSAISIVPRRGGAGGHAAFFGDMAGNVYAVDASTGTEIWRRRVDDHQIARITGAPTYHDGRLYVPVSSLEEASGGNPKYECCTFRGSVVSLDAETGAVRWKTYVLDDPKPLGRNAAGVMAWGPSGAAIWNAPTLDLKRRTVYAATGNQYTGPERQAGDAVVAFNMDTGALEWTRQLLPKDIFVGGCVPNSPGPRCPEELGPDFDFGNSPILVSLQGGRDLIVIGQKSGVGWAIDPDRRGELVWQYRASRGGLNGGMEWGSAADDQHAYFPVSDVPWPGFPTAEPLVPGGLHAVRLDTGQAVWVAPPQKPRCSPPGRGCDAGQIAAITVIPGIVFSGANDGTLRAYRTSDGTVVWEFDSNRTFETVNGVKATGASMNGAGPTIVDGMVYVNSGYSNPVSRAGNVLLAFGLP
jgi:polyvinyl alcohol dehydrogenase (cytochrome)